MRRRTIVVGAVLVLAGAVPAADAAQATTVPVVPVPASVQAVRGAYTLTPGARIVVDGGAGAHAVANDLAAILRRSTGFALPISAGGARAADIELRRARSQTPPLGREGYTLSADAHGLRLAASDAEGLYRGVQTIRQLLPPAIESATAQPGPWTISGVRISDRPRFSWRGAMLDVARHFMSVAEVERYIDDVSLYKINVLHLHLTDDQGWRIMIDSWPRLAAYGGSLEVGGTPGGYYSTDDYRAIVAYAAAHYVTVVPEIDTPGHTNAALASYAQLNCNGVAPPLYTGTDVGFSSLCVPLPITYQLLDDVIGTLAALTPGRYIHIGGDEAKSTTPAAYLTFMTKVEQIVHAHGKSMMGWQEIGAARPSPGDVAQVWHYGDHTEPAAARQGAKLVMSPANHAYLDMKYNPKTPLGRSWAGSTNVHDAYGWDPTTLFDVVHEKDVLGVEAPLWTETITDIPDAEYMAFPRLPAVAEIGWSPRRTHDWTSFRRRLAAQGPRWAVMGVNYYRSAEIPWPR
jgi:hexosaminidase